MGTPWLLERSKERSGIAWLGFHFKTNTHMHTYIHSWLSHASTEEEREEEKKNIGVYQRKERRIGTGGDQRYIGVAPSGTSKTRGEEE